MINLTLKLQRSIVVFMKAELFSSVSCAHPHLPVRMPHECGKLDIKNAQPCILVLSIDATGKWCEANVLCVQKLVQSTAEAQNFSFRLIHCNIACSKWLSHLTLILWSWALSKKKFMQEHWASRINCKTCNITLSNFRPHITVRVGKNLYFMPLYYSLVFNSRRP